MKRSLTFLAIATLTTLPSLAAPTAFKGATIHPVSGPPIQVCSQIVYVESG